MTELESVQRTLEAAKKIAVDQILHRYPGMTREQAEQLLNAAIQRRINNTTNSVV